MTTIYSLMPPHESEFSPEASHTPVMVTEVLTLLNGRPGALMVDATVGLGGHSEKILEQIGPTGKLIGIDRDKESLAIARKRLEAYSNVQLYSDNFKNLPLILHHLGQTQVDGILLDLGVSSYQL